MAGIAAGLAVAGAGMAVSGIAAENQRSTQKDQFTMQMEAANKLREEAVSAAMPKADEIAAVNTMIKNRDLALKRSQEMIDRERTLLDSVDPAIKSAGEQASRLIAGQEANMLQPIKSRLEKQRQDLKDNLRNQLGPGAETSTAGMAALQQFDESSTLQMAQIQQQAFGSIVQGLQGLSGSRASITSSAEESVRGAGALAQGVTTAYQNQADRELKARIGVGIPGAPETQQPGAASPIGSGLQSIGGTIFGHAVGGGNSPVVGGGSVGVPGGNVSGYNYGGGFANNIFGVGNPIK
jgi:hypothetical protein